MKRKLKSRESNDESSTTHKSAEDELNESQYLNIELEEESKSLPNIEMEGDKDDHTKAIEEEPKDQCQIPNDLQTEYEIAKAVSNLSIETVCSQKYWNLQPFLLQKLKEHKIHSFFPIQSLVIHDIISSHTSFSTKQSRDVCVNAATGSGKTLAYVIPLLHLLSTRVLPKLRVIVVLPSRDLAQQVYRVFQEYANKTLEIGLCIGGGRGYPKEEADYLSVDIIVCTPGRLLECVRKGLVDLAFLQFLILDEADRLTNQSFHNWIQELTFYSSQTTLPPAETLTESTEDPTKFEINPLPKKTSFRKFLFSATLTENPQQLALLDLVFPKYYNVDQMLSSNEKEKKKKYHLPSTLQEYNISCTATQKPLLLFSLLLKEQSSNQIILIFTSSIDTNHRLTRLLQILYLNYHRNSTSSNSNSSIIEFSSRLSQSQRTLLIQKCKENQVSIMVASDSMSRGIDLVNISCVIHYDIPNVVTYVHRCGRTARANQNGKAIALVEDEQQFKQMIQKKLKTNQIKMNLEIKKDILPIYTKSLRVLKKVMEMEACGKLGLFDTFNFNFISSHLEIKQPGSSSEGSSSGTEDDSQSDES